MAAPVKHVAGRVVGTVGPDGLASPRRAERPPLAPCDIDAERAVLGSILILPETTARVNRIVRPEHFLRPSHVDIYAAMLRLFEEGVELDNVTLAGELERQGVLEACGGRAYLTELLAATPTATHAVHYATIVRRRATERALIEAAGQIARSAFDGDDDALMKSKLLLHQLDGDMEQAETGDLDDALADLMAPRPSGWSTGIGVIDHWLGGVGLAPARSLVITGQSGAGKTLLATSMALSAAAAGAKVVFFSLEMSRAEMLTRIGAYLFGGRMYRLLQVPSDRWTDGDRETFRRVVEWRETMRARQLFTLYQDQYHTTDIVARSRIHGADVVVVDWYQQLEMVRERGQTADDVDRIQSGALIKLAKAAGACVVIVSQLNATGGAKYGAWLNSHAHARLHLENVENSQTRVRISPLKNRWGGDSASGATAEFEADKAVGRFTPLYQEAFQ